jgi:hypothetical protein
VEVPACPSYIEAFYSTRLFKIERRCGSAVAKHPLTWRPLAAGTRYVRRVAVEGRANDQLLMHFRPDTISLMSEAVSGAETPGTRLYFGSAVVPATPAGSGRSQMGFVFRALLGFHKLYSRMLLRAAASAVGA